MIKLNVNSKLNTNSIVSQLSITDIKRKLWLYWALTIKTVLLFFRFLYRYHICIVAAALFTTVKKSSEFPNTSGNGSFWDWSFSEGYWLLQLLELSVKEFEGPGTCLLSLALLREDKMERFNFKLFSVSPSDLSLPLNTADCEHSVFELCRTDSLDESFFCLADEGGLRAFRSLVLCRTDGAAECPEIARPLIIRKLWKLRNYFKTFCTYFKT